MGDGQGPGEAQRGLEVGRVPARQGGHPSAPPCPLRASVSHLCSERQMQPSRCQKGALGFGLCSATDSHWPLRASVCSSVQSGAAPACGWGPRRPAPYTGAAACLSLSRPLPCSARCPRCSQGRERSGRLLPRAPGGQPPARPPRIAGIPGLASQDPTLEGNQAAWEEAGSEQGVLGRAEAPGGGQARPGVLRTHERGAQ